MLVGLVMKEIIAVDSRRRLPIEDVNFPSRLKTEKKDDCDSHSNDYKEDDGSTLELERSFDAPILPNDVLWALCFPNLYVFVSNLDLADL